ncbi:hypothetical protein M406DRAFT_60741 [Cryphonectria parasitica EP155]|uniref:UmuC domain-containing protein n=1 Tax=Cryphonectria parasitica (strain ATCC 38755 / EP155) TaxID=660469 RepID=A0A9P4Y4J6_CRYP1|nr:uncharacterized protein M406DRAFT_60741 [Cryphonectria parasitica EP155]KAF3766334.1 hypothetical protein M406DRAFT_60741 [Cryphonectria parasitica EP155]
MDFSVKTKKIPRMKQDRIVLHFDYDCFYAQVVENSQPALRSLPLGIKQKSILATCNYVARNRGVRKLQAISEAKKICPDLVLADGEDLSAFRDVSKRLYGLLRSYSWNKKVERLGLDEIFLDVTDIIAYNVGLLNANALSESFFCLAPDDPEKGFPFDASAFAGCVVEGTSDKQGSYENPLFVRLVLASHLARYLRLKIEEEGYTSACGISTNKLLSKLAGSVHKPRNQTTLLSFDQKDVLEFVDPHGLRKVPGIGGKITHALESFFLGRDAGTASYTEGSAVTVGELRGHPDVSPQMLERLLGSRPGSERGIGEKVWALVHGIDETEVKAAYNVPTQISIEDTYPGLTGGLNTAAEVEREMLKLSASLLRRMYVDLTEDEEADEKTPWSPTRTRRKWLAHPKTLRLSTRPKTSHNDDKPYNWGRSSRSQPLPTFLFTGSSDTLDDEAIVAKLVREALLPMFSALNPAKDGWNIGMINICVANMVPTAAEPGASGSGRDISQMFRRQEDVLRDFRDSANDMGAYDVDTAEGETGVWHELDGNQACPQCGHFIPPFALAAHERYHDLGDG